jgi:thioesterase domain-containing protein/acyl carrier protein
MQQADSTDKIVPRDALELQLVRIWEELLHQSPIGVNEDFFQLGGDSLVAMSLLGRIASETSYNLPAGGIFQTRTVEALAAALRQGCSPDAWTPLVAIQPEGAARPFFCVHPGGGNVLCYLRLSQHLGTDQPFFGLQAPGLDGICEPLTSVEAMAARYVAAIRRSFPTGPYSLGGWSVGGVVAFEMAQQLRAAQQEVRTLAIIDSGVLYSCAVLTALFPKGGPGVLDLLRQPLAEQVADFRARSAVAQLVPQNADDKLAGRILHLFATNMKAVMNYRAKRYDSRIDVFQAAEPVVAERFEPHREWSQLCDDVRLHVVQGNHLSLVHEPHVSELAQALRECLTGSQ